MISTRQRSECCSPAVMVSSMSLPDCPLHLWAFSTLHQVCMAWSPPPGAHHHLHPCCHHGACHPQQALVKAANSELNNIGEGSPSLNEIQPHLMIISRVLLKQSASSRQAQVWSFTDVAILRRLKVIVPTFPSVQPVFRLGADWHDFAYVQALSSFTKMRVKNKP